MVSPERFVLHDCLAVRTFLGYNTVMWQRSKNIYHLVTSFAANFFYGFPGRRLVVIGVTGTSGKTTTTHMIYEILKVAGLKVSTLSSIRAVIGGKEFDTGFHVTTPDPHVLPRFLKMAADHGDKYFVLEVSSHALDQNRAAFIPFHIGVLTTLAHEHLDYHKTMENYANAKFKLLHASDMAVVPAVGLGDSIKQTVGFDRLKKVVSFGLKDGDQTQKAWNFHLKMPGEFNILNALAAATVGSLLKLDRKTIKKALENFSGIPGRFEELKTNKNFRVVIDFAHKPDALEQLLLSAKKEIKNSGRIIVMYGCASQRDTLKRPIMGEISGRLAEVTILTDEDPRFEEPIKIINEIAEGCLKAGAQFVKVQDFEHLPHGHLFYKIPNRKEAIEFILTKLAKKDDIVLLCGKGHEKSMNYKGKELPWSEHEVVKGALSG